MNGGKLTLVFDRPGKDAKLVEMVRACTPCKGSGFIRKDGPSSCLACKGNGFRAVRS